MGLGGFSLVTIQDWGAIGEIIGAIAVCATLLYLSFQVSEAKKSTKAQVSDNVLTSWSREIRGWGENERVASIMGKGINDFKALSQPEKLIFHVRADALFVEYLRQKELFEQGVWDWPDRNIVESVIGSLIISPGGEQWWSEYLFMSPARHHIESFIEKERDSLKPASDLSWLRAPSA